MRSDGNGTERGLVLGALFISLKDCMDWGIVLPYSPRLCTTMCECVACYSRGGSTTIINLTFRSFPPRPYSGGTIVETSITMPSNAVDLARTSVLGASETAPDGDNSIHS